MIHPVQYGKCQETYYNVVSVLKASHLEQRYGRFLSRTVSQIHQLWTVLPPLMHMLVRSIGEFIYRVSSKSPRTCYFLIHILMNVSLFPLCGNSVLWCPSGKSDKLISMDEQNLVLWSLDSSKKIAEVVSKETAGMRHSLSGGAWNPHDVNSMAATSESSIQFWDLRTMKYVTIFFIYSIPACIASGFT